MNLSTKPKLHNLGPSIGYTAFIVFLLQTRLYHQFELPCEKNVLRRLSFGVLLSRRANEPVFHSFFSLLATSGFLTGGFFEMDHLTGGFFVFGDLTGGLNGKSTGRTGGKKKL